ncbi:GNAT family N-acetyltransferase [Streptomyces sp. ACA25]|uniref:GNAT family N-acetyltransferase n=1 Tax=Streptomyces sp. ACA25 TaxID=3022596 RepID=UPI00230745B9|nr:GNAT family N-acetyltransferase [Streptomyces sp. ACA25]MDB1089191.1 GNAT family N-acetyltransferase [Streptomyces sp. ACA25]
MSAPASLTTVTTWYLEQTSAADLLPAREPESASGIRVVPAEVPSPEFSRFLYAAVGSDVSWYDRLVWDREKWRAFLDRPGAETWVAYERGTPAGFLELVAQDGGVVEISSFGLLPAFRGRRIGGHLLSLGTARAWDLAERTPDREPTRRVWLHTCSRDSPHALDNYRRRGFRVFDRRVTQEPEAPAAEAWPATTGTAAARPEA